MTKLPFRLRISIWTAGTMGVSLVLFGYGLFLTQRERLRTEIDSEMQRALGRFRMRPPLPGGPPGSPPEPFRRNFSPPGSGALLLPGADLPDRTGTMPDVSDPIRAFEGGMPVWPDGYGNVGGRRVRAPSPESVRVARQGRSDFRTVAINGDSVRVHSIPIRLPDGQEGAVQIVRRLSEFDLWERNQLSTLGIFVPIACFIAGLGAFLIASIGLRPVRSMARTAQFISAQNLGARLPVQGSDELAQLGTSFNAVLDRLEDAFQRQRQFTADASHDLRTPLTRIRLLAQHRSDDPAELKKALEQCGNSAETLTRLVDQLLVLSRADSGGEWIRPTRTRASEVIAGALERLPETDRILTELPTDEPVVIWDQQAVSRVVSNLLENALSHSPPDTVVNLVVSWTPDWVTLIVKDSGEGIPEEKQEHIFSRFSRLDNARTETGHSGLGLAIVRAIAEAHGGQVFVSSQPNKGATFTLRLPFTAT